MPSKKFYKKQKTNSKILKIKIVRTVFRRIHWPTNAVRTRISVQKTDDRQKNNITYLRTITTSVGNK